MAYPAASERPE